MRNQVSVLVLLMACGTFVFASGQKDLSTPETMEIRLGTVTAATGSQEAAFATKFIERVTELSDGKITVQYFPGGQLGSQRDMLQQAQLGELEIVIAASNMIEIEPKFGVFDLPYIFRSNEHAWKVLDGEIGREMNQVLSAKNLIVLAYSELGFRQTSNNIRPIVTPDDFQGLKIRTPENKLRIETFKALGAAPTPVSFGELYTALQQGVVDGQENPLSTIVSMKFYEVQKYVSLTKHVYSPSYVTASLIWWNSLNDEQRRIFGEAAQDAKQYAREVNTQQTGKLIDVLQENGIQVNDVDIQQFIDKASSVWESYKPVYGEDLINRIANTR